MKVFLNGKSLIVTGGVFVVIIFAIIYVLIRIGGAYRSGLDTFSLDEQISDVTHTEREKINKITIKTPMASGCMEVTPDGIIRVFSVCEKELSEARRVTDTKYILQLYKKIAETDLSKIQTETTAPCEGYSIIVETDTEKKTVCLQDSSGNNSSSGGNTNNGDDTQESIIIDEIIKIIDQVIDNIPPTPTTTPNPIIVTTTLAPGMSATPTTAVIPSWGVTPVPTSAVSRPFMCDYIDSQGKKRPYTISNIICSSEPSPAPTPEP
jgi:hypothetical protein